MWVGDSDWIVVGLDAVGIATCLNMVRGCLGDWIVVGSDAAVC